MESPKSQALIGRWWVIGALLGPAIFLFPRGAQAASLFISPSAESVVVGQTFTLSVDVSSADEAMNAASGDISFPSDKLQVLSVSKANSVMDLWIRDPSFTNSRMGSDVHFEGVTMNPGFLGNDGNLITITFEAVAAGDAPISFSSGAVLANDGKGTNLLSIAVPGDVTVVEPVGTKTTPSATTSSVSASRPSSTKTSSSTNAVVVSTTPTATTEITTTSTAVEASSSEPLATTPAASSATNNAIPQFIQWSVVVLVFILLICVIALEIQLRKYTRRIKNDKDRHE